MTDPEQHDLPELELEPLDEAAAFVGDLEAQPAITADALSVDPAAAMAVAEAGPGEASGDAAAGGQWVWQYGAPPPPPPFGAVFFSGTALPELYRFFGCGMLVIIGCLLPWGPVANADGGLLAVPDVIGAQTLLGALSLVIGGWLCWSACYGIYTRRQKILPVFLMLEPAVVSWLRLLDGFDKAGEGADILKTLDAVGTGVVLTLIGSTLVSLQFLFVVGKVYAKKDDKGGAAARRGAAKGKGKADSASDDGGKSGKTGKAGRKSS